MTGYHEGLLQLLYVLLQQSGYGNKNTGANRCLLDAFCALRDAGYIQSIQIGSGKSWVLTVDGLERAMRDRMNHAACVAHSMVDVMQNIEEQSKK